MVCDSSAAAVPVRPEPSMHLVQQCDPAGGRCRVVAERRGEARLGVEDATEAEELILDLVDLVVDLGTLQQGQPRRVLDPVDEVRLRGPPLRRGRSQQLQPCARRPCPRTAGPTRRTFASGSSVGSARCLVRLGSAMSTPTTEPSSSASVVRPGDSRLPATSSNSLVSAARAARLAARSRAADARLDRRARRCHLVELVEEAVDRRRLRGRIGDVGADQLVGLLDRFLAEALPQLPNELLAHELNLLRALSLQPFGLDASLLLQLAGNALGVMPSLVGDLGRLRLGVLERLGVHGVGVGEFLRRLGTLGERGTDGVLLLLHQRLHRRHHVASTG